MSFFILPGFFTGVASAAAAAADMGYGSLGLYESVQGAASAHVAPLERIIESRGPIRSLE
jgi:hypothetical protein